MGDEKQEEDEKLRFIKKKIIDGSFSYMISDYVK